MTTTATRTEPMEVLPHGIHRLVLPLIAGAIVMGQLQSILAVLLPRLTYVSYLDDALIISALLCSLPALTRSPGAPSLLIFLWFAALGMAAMYSTVALAFSSEEITFMFRQVAMPAVLILIGITLLPVQWKRLCYLIIVVGLINVLYVIVELTVGRPIDPVKIASEDGRYVGYYNGSDILTGASFERAGGLVLNPPIAGIVLAAALVCAVYVKKLPYRLVIVIALAAATWATGSRGGILIAIIGIVLPWAARKFNAWVALVVMVLVSIPFGIEIASHKGSGRHASGLVQGLTDAFFSPLGRGFGFVGNHRPEEVDTGAGESLLGIAFSSAGLVTVLLVVVLVVAYLSKLNRGGDQAWVSALALGGVFAALFSETAGSIDGTVPVWLAAGIALSGRLSTKLTTPQRS